MTDPQVKGRENVGGYPRCYGVTKSVRNEGIRHQERKSFLNTFKLCILYISVSTTNYPVIPPGGITVIPVNNYYSSETGGSGEWMSVL